MASSISTANERILAAQNQNASLLKILHETEHASSALAQASKYLTDLENDLQAREQGLKLLGHSLWKEKKEHEKYRDSTMKRLAYRMGGKKEEFASKAEKEEREYLEAVQKHFQASQQVDYLKQSVPAARSNLEQLEAMKLKHDHAQKDLDALYDSIFAGPTPEFPAEDSAENPVNALRQEFAATQTRLSTESQTVSILAEANKFMKRAGTEIESARSASSMDVWGFGGSFADMSERSSLASAQSHASQVEMLVSQARRTQPSVNDIGQMNIAGGHVMGDIIFDNIFSDLAMHDKIKASQLQMQKAAARLVTELQAAKQREAIISDELKAVGDSLQTARQNLERVRSDTFQRVAGGLPEYQDEAPPYTP